MAKKSKPFSVVCAFWGLLIASAVFVASGIFNAFGLLTGIVGILDLVGKIALFLAVALIAFQFVKDKKKVSRLTESDYYSGKYDPCQICLPND